MRITHYINRLEVGEIFVFGSNGSGQHGGGAARTAFEKFGAIYGQSEGLQGKSYGLNSMDGLEILKEQVDRFEMFAFNSPELTFLVTEIGCGIAGYKPEEIAPIFTNCSKLLNVFLPESFWKHIKKEF